jgi:hypothetical protein
MPNAQMALTISRGNWMDYLSDSWADSSNWLTNPLSPSNAIRSAVT